jgi:hypothetical protein
MLFALLTLKLKWEWQIIAWMRTRAMTAPVT